MDKCAVVVLDCTGLNATEYAACLGAAEAPQDNSRFVIGVICTIISSVGR